MLKTADWTSSGLAQQLNAELRGSPDVKLSRLETLDNADERTLSFVRDAKNASRWAASKAGAVLVSRKVFQDPGASFVAPTGRALLVVDDADLALITLLAELAEDPFAPPPVAGPSYVHPDAKIDPTARLGVNVVVGPGSVIGAGCVLHPGVVIGSEVKIGQRTVLFPGVVVLDRCEVGAKCIFAPNVVIGADGFGYRPAPDGRGIVKIPHIGNVVIGDMVELGAGTCIDRGKFGSTTIGAMTKLDNLVQIGHNVRVGRACIICGCCGIAGSVVIEDGVTIGGAANIADGRHVGRGATIGAGSGVLCDIPAGETWLGTPAKPGRLTLKIYSALDDLPEAMKKFRKILREE